MKNIVEVAGKMATAKMESRKALEIMTAARNEKILAAGGRMVHRVPNIRNENYKMLFVPADALLPANFPIMEYRQSALEAREAYVAYKDDKTYANRLAFEKANAKALSAFNAIKHKMAEMQKTKTPLRVERSACVVHSARRSLASDIAGVVYGGILGPEIITVFHNTYNMIPLSFALGRSKEESSAVAEMACKNMLYLMQTVGIDIVEDGHVLHYDFWASTSSHQKIGVAYFGEHRMMQRTAEAREFAVSFEQLNAAGGDNGAEYIKRQAILFTPSTPIGVTLNDVLMLKDIDIEKDVANAANVNLENAKIVFENGRLKLTLGDGQSFWLTKEQLSGQLRGLLLKSFAVQSKKIFDSIGAPDTVVDYDGVERVIRNYKIVMFRSCWKGDKLGYKWSEFVAMANRIAEQIPEYNKLRIVRYADSASEKSRFLSRQSTQQWIYMNDTQLDKLCAPSVRMLKKMQKLSNQLIREAEMLEEEEDRSPEADAYLARPDMIASPIMQPYFRRNWNLRKVSMAANKLKVRGQYPYLAMDPRALLLIAFCGADPTDPSIYTIKTGEINAPNLAPGQKVYFVRYPNNFLCGMVLVNHADDIYSEVGDVAILSAEGIEITRADGDFDGDEGLIVPDMVIVKMMEDVINKINPPLILFKHEKAKRTPCNTKQRKVDVATALYNGQAFNLVGHYSNVAMKEMSCDEVLCEDFLNGIGRDVILAHVATILVIDMVKTGTFPKALEREIKLRADNLKTPFSQIYVDLWKGANVSGKEYEDEGEGVADRIARTIVTNAGEYTFDSEGVVFNPKTLLADIPDDVKARRIPMFVLTDEQMEMMRRFNAARPAEWFDQLAQGKVGAKQLMVYFSDNEEKLCFLIDKNDENESIEAKQLKQEFAKFVHDFVLNLGNADYWLQLPEDIRRRVVYNQMILDAFEINCPNAIGKRANNEEEGELAKAMYARFVVRVFAEEIVDYAKPYEPEQLDESSIDDVIEEISDDIDF